MKFKVGDYVKFVDDKTVEKLRGSIGKVIGVSLDEDNKFHYHVVMEDPNLTPTNLGVRGWKYDYWNPKEEKLQLVTKLEWVLK
jgi:hypothetical protein